MIDISTGRPAMFAVGEPPWHGLGVIVNEAPTSREAIQLAGLDWTVEQWPLKAYYGDWEINVPDKVANIRTDTEICLGVVSAGYTVFQNREAFDFMDQIVSEGGAKYETAGSLRDGRRIWLLARIPGDMQIMKDDVIHPYVLLTNSHDGTTALRMIPTTIRVVCQNTLNLALKKSDDGEGLVIYHYGNLALRVRYATEKFGYVVKRMGRFKTEATYMAHRELSVDEAENYFSEVSKTSTGKPLNRLVNYFLENFDKPENTLPGIKHTAWAAFNSVSQYADHQAPVKGSNYSIAHNRLNSSWFGSANALKQKAYNLALQLV